METAAFDQMVGAIARGAEVGPGSVRLYASLGLIESRRASNGARLFQVSAIEQVRRIHAERLANRGRKRRA